MQFIVQYNNCVTYRKLNGDLSSLKLNTLNGTSSNRLAFVVTKRQSSKSVE